MTALAWLNPAEARAVPGRDPAADSEVVTDPAVTAALTQALSRAGETAAGSAARVERLLVMTTPADLDAGEITDKGYVNQRRVLRNRARLAGLLYGDPAAVPGLVTRA